MTRTAIVTGAASGIGLATAGRLTSDGYRVAMVDVDGPGLTRTAAQVAGATPYRVDLQDGGAIDRLIAELSIEWERITLLVNNAGVAVRATLIETTPDDWDRIIAVNLTAMYRMCRAVLPLMIAAGGGVIVNVASVAGIVAIPSRAAYSASKAGVIGLTRAIAVDHALAGIRANAMCPGTTDTPWIDRIVSGADDPEAARRLMAERQLDHRLGTPDEVAAGIAFLASDEARFVNGSVFVMDGGMTAV